MMKRKIWIVQDNEVLHRLNLAAAEDQTIESAD